MSAQQPSQPLQAETNAEPSTSRPLPRAWIERLFERLSCFYGTKFADLWRGCDLDAVKQAWAEALAGYTPDEIKRGLNACMTRPFPPTLPEFLVLCRQPIDAETAYAEAVEQLRKRDAGTDRWSHPAIYWAAVKLGEFDMRNSTWSSIKARWSAVLQDELAKGQWPAVPPRRGALPPPGQCSANVDSPAYKAFIESMKRLGPKPPPKEWAYRVLARAELGENVPHIAVKMAEDVVRRERADG